MILEAYSRLSKQSVAWVTRLHAWPALWSLGCRIRSFFETWMEESLGCKIRSFFEVFYKHEWKIMEVFFLSFWKHQMKLFVFVAILSFFPSRTRTETRLHFQFQQSCSQADEQNNGWGQQVVSYIFFARARFSTSSQHLESQKWRVDFWIFLIRGDNETRLHFQF